MNLLSIGLYLRYKADIRYDTLEFAVNSQHMNGGIAVDTWGRSSLPGPYAIGEAAGTHGVMRPRGGRAERRAGSGNPRGRAYRGGRARTAPVGPARLASAMLDLDSRAVSDA